VPIVRVMRHVYFKLQIYYEIIFNYFYFLFFKKYLGIFVI